MNKMTEERKAEIERMHKDKLEELNNTRLWNDYTSVPRVLVHIFEEVDDNKYIDKLIDVTSDMEWNIDGFGDMEFEYLTLKEIYEQCKEKYPNELVYAIQNEPLKAKIYLCGNYAEGVWFEWGEGRGYA